MTSFCLPSDSLTCNDEHIDFFSVWEEEEKTQIRNEAYSFQQWEFKWEDGGGEDEKTELAALLSKQAAHGAAADDCFRSARDNAVKWVIASSLRHGFATQTALLAVNFLDRFLSVTSHQQPWMTQLSAVASLSLAAKMEEIRVPLLLDLQVIIIFQYYPDLYFSESRYTSEVGGSEIYFRGEDGAENGASGIFYFGMAARFSYSAFLCRSFPSSIKRPWRISP